ncbi:DinB family protein [Humibacter sp. RRB41]|uniref:DinB family protein n=1 Tax=Humibacter sp. RRB41 TaxID=2919946 RepID=UPI001FA9F61F|nr:DinB family protein [Humibacter sp. RRB41]
MAAPEDAKSVLHQYLRAQRDALVAKLDGLGEYDIRRPMTPTGTNLLGLVKHVGSVQLGYLGEVFGRASYDLDLPWLDDEADAEGADMWATADESREFILDFYRTSCERADATIGALELDSPGVVPWWAAERRDVTLHRVLVHLCVEVARHAGHADILRENIDGATGNRNEHPVQDDPKAWSTFVGRIEGAAQQVRDRAEG